MSFLSSARTSSSTDIGYWSCEGGGANDGEGRADATQDGQLSSLSTPVQGSVDSRLPQMPPGRSHTTFKSSITCSASGLGNLKPDLCRGVASVGFSGSPFEPSLDSPPEPRLLLSVSRSQTCILHEGEVTAMSLREPVVRTQRMSLSCRRRPSREVWRP